MLQRSRNSAAFLLIGTVGCLATVGAVVFGVMQLRYLAAAEAPAIEPFERDQPIGDAVDVPPLPPAPVPTLKPLPVTRPVAAARPNVAAESLRRVPAFTEMEAKAEAALDTPVTIRFEDVDFRTAFERLSELAGVPIEPSPGLLHRDDELTYDASKEFSAEFREQTLRDVVANVFKAGYGVSPEEFLEAGFSIGVAPTAKGIEFGFRGIGPEAGRDTRVYIVGHLFQDSDDAQKILNLVYSQCGGYWRVPTADGRGGVWIAGHVMTLADDNDVLMMAQAAGSIVHLKSLGTLVVNANPQAHFEVTRTLRLLNEVHQVSATVPVPVKALPLEQPVR